MRDKVRWVHRALALATVTVTLSSALAAQTSSASLGDLPLTDVPSANGTTLALFWSGDGGWADLTRSVSRELAANGVAVVGVNSRAWLDRDTRTADDAARDSERILRAYLTRWSRSRIILIGYSRGAGFLPFIVNRLPADLRQRVDLVALMGAEHAASFEFHLLDLVRSSSRPSDRAVIPEMQRSTGVRYFCLYGTTETDTICPAQDPVKMRIVARAGDHHFDRNYPAIAHDILNSLPIP